jgi:hypothetical protein
VFSRPIPIYGTGGKTRCCKCSRVSDSWQDLVSQTGNGDRHARDRLFATFCDELRRLAQREWEKARLLLFKALAPE